MIVVKLIGGLGNQMFQYAYGLQLAKQYNEHICFDTSFYAADKPLALYNLNVPVYPEWNKCAIAKSERVGVVLSQKVYHVLQKMIRVLGRTDRTGTLLYKKCAKYGLIYNFDPYYYDIPQTDAANKYIYGYFQGEAYFVDCIEQLRNAFTIKHALSAQAKGYLQQISNTNAVALHIRLGDYKNVKNKDLDVCSIAYYQRAIKYIAEHLGEHRLFVFTNEVEKITQILELSENTVIISGTKDYEDYMLMQQCKHFILSNSTFSWWAAYLAQNADKIIVVPEKWRHSEKDEPAIYTSQMIKLPIEN